jgi:predicted DNA-binding antitoxin AbrB/MazE fold protein
MNEFAKNITLLEGKKVQVSIAQVKEIIKLTLKALALLEPKEVEKILKKYRNKK